MKEISYDRFRVVFSGFKICLRPAVAWSCTVSSPEHNHSGGASSETQTYQCRDSAVTHGHLQCEMIWNDRAEIA